MFPTIEFNVLIVILGVMIYNSARDRVKLKRIALTDPYKSAWMKLYSNGDDQSFIEITGMNRECFNSLQRILFDEEDVRPTVGRRTSLNNAGLSNRQRNSFGTTCYICLITTSC